MKAWLKGGLIGGGISIFLIILFFGCLYLHKDCKEEFCGVICLLPYSPFFYALLISGVDFFIALLSKSIDYNLSYLNLFFGTLLFIIIGGFIGFVFDKNYSWKKKGVFLLILLVIFVPLTSFSQYLKYNDKKIFSENVIGGTYWQTADFSICNKISVFNRFQKEQCFVRLIEIKPEQKICLKLSENINRDSCYIEVGKKEKDSSYCNKVKLPGKKEQCFYELANITLDKDLCKKIINPLLFQQCVSDIAMSKGEESICKETDDKFTCYLGVALSTKNTSICDKLTNPVEINSCYSRLADQLEDISICDKIKEELFRQDCRNNYGRWIK